MKYLIPLILLLSACSVDITDDDKEDVFQTQRENTVNKSEQDIKPDTDLCRTEISYVGNCITQTRICDNKVESFTVKCSRGRELYPWEYIPDPPNL